MNSISKTSPDQLTCENPITTSELSLTDLAARAQKWSSSYASPHHFEMSVSGLRALITELQSTNSGIAPVWEMLTDSEMLTAIEPIYGTVESALTSFKLNVDDFNAIQVAFIAKQGVKDVHAH